MDESNGDDSIFRDLFRSGAIVFVGFVLEMGIAFLAKAIVARELARADYGSIAIGATLLATVSSLSLLGLHDAVGRYLPRFDASDERRGVLFSALQMVLPVAALASVGLYAGADLLATRAFGDPGTASVIRIFAFAVPFAVLTKIALGGVQGSQLTTPKVYIQNLTLPVSRFSLVAVVVILGFGVIGVAYAYVLPHVLAGVLGLYFLYSRTDLLSGSEYVPRRRDMLVFSAPLVLTSVMSEILSDIDTYLIGYLVGVGPVGTYNVVYPLAEITKVMLLSFGYIITPIFSELQAGSRQARAREVYAVATKWTLLSTLPMVLGLLLFPELAITLTFGAKYIDGATALQILSLGFLFHAFLGPNAHVLKAFGETKRFFYYNAAAAALNVVVNLLLIPRFGITGAAAATLLSTVLMNSFYNLHLYRGHDISPVSSGMLAPGAAVTATVVGIYLLADAVLADRLVVLAAVVIPSAALYPVLLVQFGGVGDEEVMIVESVEDRFGIDLGRVKRLFGRLS
ncbi:MAG: flippase [Haloferacaceae archaeon]